jgi:hypothetical protein
MKRYSVDAPSASMARCACRAPLPSEHTSRCCVRLLDRLLSAFRHQGRTGVVCCSSDSWLPGQPKAGTAARAPGRKKLVARPDGRSPGAQTWALEWEGTRREGTTCGFGIQSHSVHQFVRRVATSADETLTRGPRGAVGRRRTSALRLEAARVACNRYMTKNAGKDSYPPHPAPLLRPAYQQDAYAPELIGLQTACVVPYGKGQRHCCPCGHRPNPHVRPSRSSTSMLHVPSHPRSFLLLCDVFGALPAVAGPHPAPRGRCSLSTYPGAWRAMAALLKNASGWAPEPAQRRVHLHCSPFSRLTCRGQRI